VHCTDNYGKNWSGASAGPNTKKEVELAKANSVCHIGRNDDSITKQVLQWTPQARPQRKRATKEYLEAKRSGERNVDSRIQVQLEEDGGGSTRRSWMETSGLWTMFVPPAVTRHKTPTPIILA